MAADRISSEYNLQANRIWENCHAGKRCFIIGNGPSLKQHDLHLLRDEVTFASNAFYKHPVFEHWQPTYYCLADPAFFDGSIAGRSSLQKILEIVRSPIFLSHRGREAVESIETRKTGERFYVGFAGSLADGPPWQPDFTRVMPGVEAVTHFALMAALYMGCSPIYLLGLDHDWLAHRGVHKSFYVGQSIANQKTLGDWKYQDLTEAVLRMWKGYNSIARVAESRGQRIINLTQGGFLDVFERGDYGQVVG